MLSQGSWSTFKTCTTPIKVLRIADEKVWRILKSLSDTDRKIWRNKDQKQMFIHEHIEDEKPIWHMHNV